MENRKSRLVQDADFAVKVLRLIYVSFLLSEKVTPYLILAFNYFKYLSPSLEKSPRQNPLNV